MSKNFNRRSFIKSSFVAGSGAVLGSKFFNFASSAKNLPLSELTMVKGEDFFNNTIKAVNLLGGMSKYVPKGSKVALLINSSFRHPGTIVNPDISLAVVKMLWETKPKEIICLPGPRDSYFKSSKHYYENKDNVSALKNSKKDFKKVTVKSGKSLKEAEVLTELLEADVLINVPIAKDHTGTKFTGVLKNMMGTTSRNTNQYFHKGSNPNASGWYEDVAFLSQCIADVNLLRKANLSIVDVTNSVITNGPFGPGELVKNDTIIASNDIIAADTQAATIIGRDPQKIDMIKMGAEHGLGEMDLKKVRIKKA